MLLALLSWPISLYLGRYCLLYFELSNNQKLVEWNSWYKVILCRRTENLYAIDVAIVGTIADHKEVFLCLFFSRGFSSNPFVRNGSKTFWECNLVIMLLWPPNWHWPCSYHFNLYIGWFRLRSNGLKRLFIWPFYAFHCTNTRNLMETKSYTRIQDTKKLVDIYRP